MFICDKLVIHVGNGIYHIVCENNRSGDIYDGALYQELLANGFLIDTHNISLLFNTDGVPVFRSSAFAFWPLYLVINELPYKLRYAYRHPSCMYVLKGTCQTITIMSCY